MEREKPIAEEGRDKKRRREGGAKRGTKGEEGEREEEERRKTFCHEGEGAKVRGDGIWRRRGSEKEREGKRREEIWWRRGSWMSSRMRKGRRRREEGKGENPAIQRVNKRERGRQEKRLIFRLPSCMS